MRFDASTTFYLVTDAGPGSELSDIFNKTNLIGLLNQFKGGLTLDQHPTIFSNQAEAKAEAEERLDARKAYDQRLQDSGQTGSDDDFWCVVHDPLPADEHLEWTDLAVLCESERHARSLVQAINPALHPKLYTNAAQAEADARKRLETRRNDDEKA